MQEKNSRPSSWREFVEWSSTDSQLLLRHVRFLFLVAPLVCSSVVAWTWLVAYWDDLYRNGPGEPLTEAGPQPDQLQGPSAYALRGALLWLPVRAYPLTAVLRWLPYLLAPPPCTASAEPYPCASLSLCSHGLAPTPRPTVARPLPRVALARLQNAITDFLDTHLLPLSSMGGGDAGSAGHLSGGGFVRPSPASQHATPPLEHPSGISKNWSMLYVWLQYVQWYKVLCWLLVLVLGGSEGLLPAGLREAFRVEELLLASRAGHRSSSSASACRSSSPRRATSSSHGRAPQVVRLIFYSAFTSHVEVASSLACESVVAVHLLYDWVTSAANDYSLRLNLNRLRSGYFAIASMPRADGGVAAARPAGAASGDGQTGTGAQRRARQPAAVANE